MSKKLFFSKKSIFLQNLLYQSIPIYFPEINFSLLQRRFRQQSLIRKANAKNIGIRLGKSLYKKEKSMQISIISKKTHLFKTSLSGQLRSNSPKGYGLLLRDCPEREVLNLNNDPNSLIPFNKKFIKEKSPFNNKEFLHFFYLKNRKSEKKIKFQQKNQQLKGKFPNNFVNIGKPIRPYKKSFFCYWLLPFMGFISCFATLNYYGLFLGRGASPTPFGLPKGEMVLNLNSLNKNVSKNSVLLQNIQIKDSPIQSKSNSQVYSETQFSLLKNSIQNEGMQKDLLINSYPTSINYLKKISFSKNKKLTNINFQNNEFTDYSLSLLDHSSKNKYSKQKLETLNSLEILVKKLYDFSYKDLENILTNQEIDLSINCNILDNVQNSTRLSKAKLWTTIRPKAEIKNWNSLKTFNSESLNSEKTNFFPFSLNIFPSEAAKGTGYFSFEKKARNSLKFLNHLKTKDSIFHATWLKASLNNYFLSKDSTFEFNKSLTNFKTKKIFQLCLQSEKTLQSETTVLLRPKTQFRKINQLNFPTNYKYFIFGEKLEQDPYFLLNNVNFLSISKNDLFPYIDSNQKIYENPITSYQISSILIDRLVDGSFINKLDQWISKIFPIQTRLSLKQSKFNNSKELTLDNLEIDSIFSFQSLLNVINPKIVISEFYNSSINKNTKIKLNNLSQSLNQSTFNAKNQGQKYRFKNKILFSSFNKIKSKKSCHKFQENIKKKFWLQKFLSNRKNYFLTITNQNKNSNLWIDNNFKNNNQNCIENTIFSLIKGKNQMDPVFTLDRKNQKFKNNKRINLIKRNLTKKKNRNQYKNCLLKKKIIPKFQFGFVTNLNRNNKISLQTVFLPPFCQKQIGIPKQSFGLQSGRKLERKKNKEKINKLKINKIKNLLKLVKKKTSQQISNNSLQMKNNANPDSRNSVRTPLNKLNKDSFYYLTFQCLKNSFDAILNKTINLDGSTFYSQKISKTNIKVEKNLKSKLISKNDNFVTKNSSKLKPLTSQTIAQIKFFKSKPSWLKYLNKLINLPILKQESTFAKFKNSKNSYNSSLIKLAHPIYLVNCTPNQLLLSNHKKLTICNNQDKVILKKQFIQNENFTLNERRLTNPFAIKFIFSNKVRNYINEHDHLFGNSFNSEINSVFSNKARKRKSYLVNLQSHSKLRINKNNSIILGSNQLNNNSLGFVVQSNPLANLSASFFGRIEEDFLKKKLDTKIIKNEQSNKIANISLTETKNLIKRINSLKNISNFSKYLKFLSTKIKKMSLNPGEIKSKKKEAKTLFDTKVKTTRVNSFCKFKASDFSFIDQLKLKKPVGHSKTLDNLSASFFSRLGEKAFFDDNFDFLSLKKEMDKKKKPFKLDKSAYLFSKLTKKIRHCKTPPILPKKEADRLSKAKLWTTTSLNTFQKLIDNQIEKTDMFNQNTLNNLRKLNKFKNVGLKNSFNKKKAVYFFKKQKSIKKNSIKNELKCQNLSFSKKSFPKLTFSEFNRKINFELKQNQFSFSKSLKLEQIFRSYFSKKIPSPTQFNYLSSFSSPKQSFGLLKEHVGFNLNLKNLDNLKIKLITKLLLKDPINFKNKEILPLMKNFKNIKFFQSKTGMKTFTNNLSQRNSWIYLNKHFFLKAPEKLKFSSVLNNKASKRKKNHLFSLSPNLLFKNRVFIKKPSKKNILLEANLRDQIYKNSLNTKFQNFYRNTLDLKINNLTNKKLSVNYLSLLQKRKYQRKKHRKKKQKKETRRRKKRKRSLPRPVWFRSQLYNKFLKSRYFKNQKTFTMQEKNMKKENQAINNPNSLFKKNCTNKNLLKKINGLRQTVYRNYKQNWSNIEFKENQVENLTKVINRSKSDNSLNVKYFPFFGNGDFYVISRSILGDFKKFFWKSYWLRSNLNSYLNRVKSFLTQIKESNKNYQLNLSLTHFVKEQTFGLNSSKREITCPKTYVNFSTKSSPKGYKLSPRKDNCATSPCKRFADKALDNLPVASATDSLRQQNGGVFGKEKQPLWAIFSKKKLSKKARKGYNFSNLGIKSQKFNNFKIFGNINIKNSFQKESSLSSNFGKKWQISTNINEYQRIIYQRIQQIIFNIRENLNLNGQIKARSSKIGRKKIQTPKNIKEFWVKFGKAITFETPNIYAVNFYGDISKLRTMWALNKSNLTNLKEKNNRKNLWINQKQREQTQYNKTKKIMHQMTKKFTNVRNEHFIVSNQKNQISNFTWIQSLRIKPFFSQYLINRLLEDFNSEKTEDLNEINSPILLNINKVPYQEELLTVKHPNKVVFDDFSNQAIKIKDAQKNVRIEMLEEKTWIKTMDFNVTTSSLVENLLIDPKDQNYIEGIEKVKRSLDISQVKLKKKENKLAYLGFLNKKINMNMQNYELRDLKKQLLPFNRKAIKGYSSEIYPKNKKFQIKQNVLLWKTSLSKKRKSFKLHLVKPSYLKLRFFNKFTSESNYWWNSFSLKLIPEFKNLFDVTQTSASPELIEKATNATNSRNLLIWTSTFLFHFCAFLFLINSAEIRGLIKFYIILISNIFKAYLDIAIKISYPLLKNFNGFKKNKTKENNKLNNFTKELEVSILIKQKNKMIKQFYFSEIKTKDFFWLNRRLKFKPKETSLIFQNFKYDKTIQFFINPKKKVLDKEKQQFSKAKLWAAGTRLPYTPKGSRLLLFPRAELWVTTELLGIASQGKLTNNHQFNSKIKTYQITFFSELIYLSFLNILTKLFFKKQNLSLSNRKLMAFKVSELNTSSDSDTALNDRKEKENVNINESNLLFPELALTVRKKKETSESLGSFAFLKKMKAMVSLLYPFGVFEELNTKEIKDYDSNKFDLKKNSQKNSMLIKYYLINFIKLTIDLSYQGSFLFYSFLFKSVDIFQAIISSIYSCFEKPGEVIVDWIAYSFLVQWSSDLITTIPDALDISRMHWFLKISRGVRPFSLAYAARFYFHKSLNDSFLISTGLLLSSNGLIQRRILHIYQTIIEKWCQPDTDLIIRQKKGIIFWDLWSEILIEVAEDANINTSELSSLKEEQNRLLEKLEGYQLLESQSSIINFNFNINNFRNKKILQSYSSSLPKKNLVNSSIKEPIKTFNMIQKNPYYSLKNHNVSSILAFNNKVSKESTVFNKEKQQKVKTKSLVGSNFKTNIGLISKTRILEPSLGSQHKRNWSVNQFLSYQGKDTELFIQKSPSKSFSSIPSIKYSNSAQQPIGTIVCQIFSGLFTKQVAKNILVVGSSATRNETLLIQAIAGETELKIIIDNAHRYSMVYSGVAIGIKLLRDVFETLSFHTPCIFLLEDIHHIGGRRPLLISDQGELGQGNEFGSEKEEIHEKNQVSYQLSKHLVSHYKKPYKGDFSMVIPTNHFCFNLFLGVSSPQIRNNPIPLSSSLDFESSKKNGNSNSKNTKSNDDLEDINGEVKTNILSSSFQIQSNNLLAPPATSPFSVLLLKEDIKLKAKQVVKEIPWAGLPSEKLALISKSNYSIGVKIALLADMALANVSVKLDMITDFLVIIDSVKGNRGFIVFGTTHIPYILDPALRRPGRFDETISLPLVPNLFSRWEILKINFQNLTKPSLYSSFSKGVSIDFTNISAFKLNYELSKFSNRVLTFTPRVILNSNRNLKLNKRLKNLPVNSNHLTLTYHLTNKFEQFINPFQVKNSLLKKKNLALNSQLNFVRNKAIQSTTNLENRASIAKIDKSSITIEKNQTKLFSGKKLFPSIPSAILTKNQFKKNYPSKVFSNLLAYTYFSASQVLTYFAINDNSFYEKSSLIINKKLKDKSKSSNFDLSTTIIQENLLNQKLLNLKPSTQNSKECIQLKKKQKTNFIMSPTDFLLFDSTSYLSLYASTETLKTYVTNLIVGKLGELFIFSAPLVQSNSKSSQINPNFIKNTGLINLYGINKTWRSAKSLLFSLITKRYIYDKNLIIPKLLYFSNYSSLHESPTPPSSNILLPLKRYENYRRTFHTEQIKNKANFHGKTLHATLDFHQQQRFIKRLYKLPIREFFRSEIINNKLTGFSNSLIMLSSVEKNINFSTNSNWYYRNRLLNRHRNYLNNQWWNGQLSEHNIENTFLSDIDWRYTFVESIGDIFIDFPDSDQFYHVKNRRWMLPSNSSENWFSFEKTNLDKIFNQYIFECFTNAYNSLDPYREILDFYAFISLNQSILKEFKEITILSLFKRFYDS